MKAWTTVCAMAALAVATVNAGAAPVQSSADSCDLIKIFSIVKPLETNEDVKKCIAATGYELLPPPGAPTKEQIAKLCDNASCKTVFATLQKMDIPDCSISILGGLNMKKVIGDAFGQCSGSTGSAAAATTAPPAAASATPSVTPAPASGKGGAAPGPAPVPVAVTPAASQAPTAVPSGNAKLPSSSGVGVSPAPAPAPAPAPGAAPGPAPTPAPASGKGKGGKKLCHD